MLPWQPEFQINQFKNLMQPFPQPEDALPVIWSPLANWLNRVHTGKFKDFSKILFYCFQELKTYEKYCFTH